MSPIRTNDKLTEFGKRLQKQLSSLKGKPHVKMGFPIEEFSKDHEKSSLTVGEIAVIHEFGSSDGRVPERSFIRATYDEKHPEWRLLTDSLKKRVVAGKLTVKQALEQIGMRQVADTRSKVADRIPPPLAPETIKRKTVDGKIGDVPLINTGQMINQTLTHKVVMPSSGQKVELGPK